MKRFAQFAGKLYPKTWRDRYGDEFEALLDDAPPGWRTAFDVVKGAFDMQLSTWTPRRILATAAILGAAIAFGASLAVPKQYASDITIDVSRANITGHSGNEPVGRHLTKVINTVVSAPSLEGIIQKLGLYKRERETAPIKAVVDEMRTAIKITPPDVADRDSRLVVRFVYPDQTIAREVDQELAGGIMDEALEQAITTRSALPLVLQINRAPTLSRAALSPNAWILSVVGCAAGMLIGFLVLAIRRVPKFA